MANISGTKVDGESLKAKILEKHKSVRAFCTETGLATSTMNDYINERSGIPKATLKLICLMLECKEEDLQKKKEEPKSTPSATNILLGEETRQTYEELLKEVHAFRNEMATLSKFIVEITRRVNEIHAQEQLTADEMRTIHSKMAEINGNFSKVYAKMTKHY